MEENPKLSLPDAFQKAHVSFGIFGFSELEESSKKMIQKRLWGYYWNELKLLFISIFILPRVLDRSITDTEALIQVYGDG
jgi:hypothetical protein